MSMGESSSSRIPRLPHLRFSMFAHVLRTSGDGYPKGEPQSPFGRGSGRESPGRGFQGAAMRPLVWVVRGTKALDSMGVQGESEVSLRSW